MKEDFFDWLSDRVAPFCLAILVITTTAGLIVLVGFVIISSWQDAYTAPVKQDITFEDFEHNEMKFTIVKHKSSWFLVVKTNNGITVTKY